MSQQELVTVSWPSHPTELAIVESMLGGDGIQYEVRNYHSDHLVGWEAIGGTNLVTRGVEVQVRAADAERARELLNAIPEAEELPERDSEREAEPRDGGLLPGFLTTAGIVLLIGGLYMLSQARDREIYFSWEPIVAEVTETAWDDDSGRRVHRYEYRFAGKPYQGAGPDQGYGRGDKLPIRVDPEDPSQSRSDFYWSNQTGSLRLAGGLAIAMTVLLFGVAWLRQRGPEGSPGASREGNGLGFGGRARCSRRVEAVPRNEKATVSPLARGDSEGASSEGTAAPTVPKRTMAPRMALPRGVGPVRRAAEQKRLRAGSRLSPAP